MKYARIESGIVVEIVDIPNGLTPSDCFHSDIASTMVSATSATVIGGGYSGGKFSAPPPIPLADMQATKIAELTASCASAIVGGYVSSALGSSHTYPSKQTDQINMMGSVTASLLPGLAAGWTTPLWCEDASGAWVFAEHTATQIQQAGSDGKAWVVACQEKLATLSASVMSATTTAAVDSIVWA